MDMETVKIDIQKLQLLNDRIAQTIDALNQVRLSAHGIQHAPFGAWPQQFGQYPQQTQVSPFAQYGSPYQGSPFMPQFGTPQFVGQQQFPVPFGGGFQHTSPTFGPTIPTTYPNPFTQTIPTTFGMQPYTTGYTGYPTGYTGHTGNGLSHTTWDPNWQLRTPYPTWIS
jgi:hypothetical protein